ncbi:glycosyltransferase family 1 protein [Lacrimispora sp.]|uniref:glycosyltransferase family 4 protein n=1 Tax=Lacrimispora sp. TaxID=2719234 RepID=UPI0032E46548
MIVGVDLSFIRPDHTNGGTETCIKNLIRGWMINKKLENFIFFIHEDIHKDYKILFPECHFICYRLRGSHKVRTTWFQTFMLPILVKRYKIDVLYYPTYTSGYYFKIGVPVVINPHDIQYKFYPEYFPFLKRWYLNFGYSHSMKRADRIIAISNYVKDSLQKFYGDQCGDKIQIVYDPVDFDKKQSFKPKGISLPYILSVSSVQKHKNMITLVRAFERIHGKIPHRLVIAGCKGNGMEKIQEYLKEKNISDKILFTDYIKSEELDWLYENCSLYVTTSLYEGFGMTPVEAMGRGKPTISSKSTSLPEVTHNKAFYYEPAEDDLVLSEVMLEVIEKGVNHNDVKDLIDCYDKSIISAQLYNVFEELL